MKTNRHSKSLALALIGCLAPLAQTNAATIATEAVADPATTDPSASFFTDAAVNFTTGANRYRTNATLAEVGSSFTHDDGSSNPWNLTTITVLAHNDGINSSTENVDGLTLRIYSGNSIAPGDQLGSDITFGTGTFDAGGGNFAYLTFNLTALETAAIGDLTQGSEYTFTIEGDADTDIRISRNVADTYSGTPYFSGASRAGNAEELVFFVGGTSVPEPSSAALLGLGGLALILRRRK